MATAAVEISPVRHSPSRTIEDPLYGSRLATWNAAPLELADDGTHFGYVHSGSAVLECDSGQFQLKSGMYFAAPGSLKISGHGTGFVATRIAWRGFFHVGGPAEFVGRLRYIDGCSDSLLIAPVVVGDPCLNLLYLPQGTTQTEHTHPSCRVGMIASGRGLCKTPDAEIALEPGLVFNISPGALHSFHTRDEPLRVIAWHPDSDFGPTDHNHPMINRTIIQGVSAADRRVSHGLQ